MHKSVLSALLATAGASSAVMFIGRSNSEASERLPVCGDAPRESGDSAAAPGGPPTLRGRSAEPGDASLRSPAGVDPTRDAWVEVRERDGGPLVGATVQFGWCGCAAQWTTDGGGIARMRAAWREVYTLVAAVMQRAMPVAQP